MDLLKIIIIATAISISINAFSIYLIKAGEPSKRIPLTR